MRVSLDEFMAFQPNPVPAPDAQEIAHRRCESGMTAFQAGRMVYLKPGRWEQFESGGKRIPIATWELWLWKAGVLRYKPKPE
jgi:hypothetical protein